MSLECVLVFGYLIVGFIMAFIWWNDEYKAKYECAKECGEAEDAMVILLFMLFIFFWPLKLVRNYFEDE